MRLPGLNLAASALEATVAALAPGSQVAAQAHALRQRAHRPWPPPDGPWLQAQTWRDLLFAHWPIPEDLLRSVVPRALELDALKGTAWIAVTPFEVTGLRLRGTWPAPILSRFAETNVRTYVSVDGRPGIYFFSLDAASRLAVLAARATYGLPYFPARMTIDREADEIRYRTTRGEGGASLHVRYRPEGPPFIARAGSLEHFLTERYCLYTVIGGAVHRAEIHHPPWTLQAASADVELNTMTDAAGIRLPEREPLLHFAARQDVLIWRASLVEQRGRAAAWSRET